MAHESKKLYRDKEHAMIGGVCAGLAEYFGIDVTIIRLLAVVLALSGGGGVLAYIIAWIIIPEKPVASSEAAKVE